MDVSKYRTRYPPKEHEEAVRMLLEGLDKPAVKPTSQNDLKPAQQQVASSHNIQRASATRNSNHVPSHRHQHEVSPTASIDSGSLVHCDQNDYDDEEIEREFRYNQQRGAASSGSGELHGHELDFNSEESSSQDQIQVSPQIPSRHFHHQRQQQQQQQQQSLNKLTNKRLVEQRLRSSIPPRMQSKGTSTTSESIASTNGHRQDAASLLTDDDLNGADHEAIPSRTIAIQCDLKLSSVKRDGYLLTDSASSDLASMQASSISSTRYGFYRLNPDTLEQRRRLARSISSRNIAHHSDDEELVVKRDSSQTVSEAGSSIVDVEAGRQDENSERANSIGRKHEQQNLFKSNQESSRVRVRDSLPRRPKTALSYVSSSRLRDRDGSDRSLSEIDDDGALISSARNQLRDRAMSQQVLSSNCGVLNERANQVRAQTASRDFETISSSNSDSELGAAERYRVPCNEEVLLTRRGQQVPLSSPPPNYMSAARTRPYEPTSKPDGQQPTRRRQTITNGVSDLINSRGRMAGAANRDHLDDQRDLTDGGQSSRRLIPKSANFVEGTDSPPLRSSNLRLRHDSDDEPRKLSRYSSMSLSRAQPMRIDRSCNLISGQIRRATGNARNSNEITGGREEARANPARVEGNSSATLTRKDRSASQQTLQSTSSRLPASSCFMATNVPNGQRSAQPSRVNEGAQPIGRSTSMRQVNTMAQGGQSGARLLSPNSRQRPAPEQRAQPERGPLYSTDCDSSCCEQASCGMMAQQRADRHLNGQAPLDRRTEYAPKRSDSEDSESPVTRTWANPSSSRIDRPLNAPMTQTRDHNTLTRKNIRAHSMREAANDPHSLGHGRNSNNNGVDGYDHGVSKYRDHDIKSQRANERFEHIYRANQAQDDEDEDDLRYQSEAATSERDMNSAASSSLEPEDVRANPLTHVAAIHHQALDFDSQQRLNEIGLPEPAASHQHPMVAGTMNRRRQALPSANSSGSSSHLGLSGGQGFNHIASHYATTGRRRPLGSFAQEQVSGPTHRGPAITGRAMSQQSLTRPTMPLSRRLRRSGNASAGSQSGASDVGGSSMSLASRMRYENAHTRSPVVMYIPQALPKSSSSEHIKRSSSSLLRRSSRQSLGRTARHSSQERAGRKSLSRQASDSDASSSSMLRTLVKPRASRLQTSAAAGVGPTIGRVPSGRRQRTGLRRDLSDDEENMDEIGQLASELDSYRFRRRYSVPKDAKINWFSKLKQRVISKN